jgi:hypothetical protein
MFLCKALFPVVSNDTTRSNFLLLSSAIEEAEPPRDDPFPTSLLTILERAVAGRPSFLTAVALLGPMGRGASREAFLAIFAPLLRLVVEERRDLFILINFIK